MKMERIYFAESNRLSPPSTPPRALKRKKLLESGWKIEAGNEKREVGTEGIESASDSAK
jgi:hypothetical protein